jgi:hypothetical protein
MPCPRCGEVNSEMGDRCQCGWDFRSESWKQVYPGEKNEDALAKAAVRRLDATKKCVHCDKVLPSFVRVCPFCDRQVAHESTDVDNLISSIVSSYFVDDWDKEKIKKKLLKELTKRGCEKETAGLLLQKTVDVVGRLNEQIVNTPRGRTEARAAAKKQIRNSLIWIVIATGISIVATASGAFLFFIWYGPVLYGIGKLIKNLLVLWALSGDAAEQ